MNELYKKTGEHRNCFFTINKLFSSSKQSAVSLISPDTRRCRSLEQFRAFRVKLLSDSERERRRPVGRVTE